jgi:uncharacterized protein YutE (UPF0331/DUF86 family)
MAGNMKFDKVKISKILSDIRRYFRDLEEQKVKKLEDLRRKDKFYSCSMLVFSLVNSAIDLGNEMISAKKLEMPHSYREIFEILSREGIIDKKMENDLIELVRIRNAIAHRYFIVTPKRLFISFQKLESLKKFAKKVEEITRRLKVSSP